MIYLSGHVWDRHVHDDVGFMLRADRWGIPKHGWLAADNGRFSNPDGYDDATYLKWLNRLPRERLLFATAPDVLGNHEATRALAQPMLAKIDDLGIHPAFVAQNGFDAATTPWDAFDVLFIGGTTQFKFRGGRLATQQALARGKKVHMGRVNSLDRLRAAAAVGCTSADGTFLAFGPDVNWRRLTNWLDALHLQPDFAM
jgi:hypothetical protein